MFCPNLSDPQIRKEFNELKANVGEKIAYYIWDKNNGNHVDKNADGTPSKLFEELVDNLGNRSRAIKAIVLTFSNKYKNFVPKSKEEPIVEEVKEQGTTPEKALAEAESVLFEVGEGTPKKSKRGRKKTAKKTDDAVAQDLVDNAEETVTTVVEEAIEEEVVTEEDQKELASLGGKKKLTETIKNLLGNASKAAFRKAVAGTNLLGRVLTKILKKLRMALLILSLSGGSIVGVTKAVGLNNTIDFATEVLPDDWKQSATRQFVKWGMYDVSQKEAVAVYKETKQKAPVKDTVSEFTEVVGTVKDELSSNPTDSLVMVRNQFDNAKGYTYLAGPMKSRTPEGYIIPNAVGVAHFLILDDQGVDLSEFTTDQELKAASDLFKKRIGAGIALTDYIPTFTRNENGVTLRYKKASDVTAEDIVLTKMINYNFGTIDFKSNKSAAQFGFKSNIKALANEDGEALPSFLFSAQGKDKYSRFSGTSVVFIFQDKFGNTIVRDFTGSLEMIEKEGNAIAEQYGVDKRAITLGVYDAGSYSAKPKANVKGELKTAQYKGYNTLHKNSAGSLIIPRSTPSPNKGLMFLPLLALVRRSRKNNQPIFQEDLDRIQEERNKLLDALNKELPSVSQEFDKLADFIQEQSSNSIDDAVKQYFNLAANKKFPTYAKTVNTKEKAAMRAEVRQQRAFRKENAPDPKKEAQALLWFKTSKIGEAIPLANLSRMINQYGFASWTKKGITLHKAGRYSDLYHEAWHEFTQMYLTQAERDALYNEVRNMVGEYKGIPLSDLTNKEVEEYLAEGFRDYAYNYKGQDTLPEPKSAVEKIYNKILKFLNWLLNKNSQIKPESKNLINQAYEQLYTGTYPQKRIGEAEFEKLYAGAIAGNYVATEAIEWPEEVEERIATGKLKNFLIPNTENQLEDGIYQLSNGTKIRLVSFPENENTSYTVDVIEDFKLTGQEAREIFKAFDYFFFEALRTREEKTTLANFLADKTGALREEVYNYIQANLNLLYEEKKEFYNKVKDTDEGLYSIERDQFLTMFLIMNNFESISNMHFKEIRKSLVELKDDVYDIEGVARNVESWAQDLGDINPIDNADPLIYTLIKGLPDLQPATKSVGNLVQRGVITGLPQTGDFNRNWNIILDTLTSASTYDEMISMLKELSIDFPQFQYLVEQLPESSEKAQSYEDLQIVAAMMQSIGVEFVPWGLGIQQEKTKTGKPGFKTNVNALSTTANKKVRNFLDTDFEQNPNRMFRTIKNGQAVLDIQPILEKYSTTIKKTLLGVNLNVGEPTVLDFFEEVFGMDFKPFVKDPRLKKVQGKLNETAIEFYKRIYLYNKEVPVNDQTIRRPLGMLSTNYKPSVLYELQRKYENDFFLNSTIEIGTKKANVGNVVNFAGDLKQVYNYYDQFYKIYGDKSFLNQENNLQYSVVPFNNLFYSLEQINKARTLDELASNLQTSSIVNSTFSKYSYMMNKLFREDGTKNVSSSGAQTKIRAINWGGVNVAKQNATSGKGKKSSNLTSQEKFLNDFFSFLTSGVFENLRFGEKNTSMAIFFDGSKNDTIQWPEETFMMGGNYFSPEFESQLLRYLAYEIDMYLKSDRKGAPFIIFSNLINEDLKQEVLSKIEQVYDPATGFSKRTAAKQLLFAEGVGTLREKVMAQVTEFFKQEVDTEMRNLSYALFNNAAGMNKSAIEYYVSMKLKEIFNLESEKQELVEEVKRKVLYYVANYFTHQIEITHLLVGNPRNYQKTAVKGEKHKNFREAFKRFGLTSSPGRQPRLTAAWLTNYNKVKTRDLEVLASKFTNAEERADLGLYNDRVRLSVFNDVFTNKGNEQAVLDYYKYQIIQEREVLGKKPLDQKKLQQEAERRYEGYTNQKKEADAQAWGNLDFIRLYLDSIRRWTPAHEAAYRFEKELLAKFLAYKQEKNSKKKAELYAEIEAMRYEATLAQFPSLKLGLYGSAENHPDSKTAGKFSVHTILPSVVIGTDLEDVMLEMLTKRVDIATFQSGSKLDFPAEVMDLYDTSKKTMKVNPIGENNIATFSIESLREQQYIAPKFKEQSTLGTQFVKLIFGDFYDSGEFSSDFSDEVKEVIQKAQQDFTDTIAQLVALEKENLAYESGVILDQEGRVADVDKEVFYKWLQKQGEARDTTEDFINFTRDAYEYSLSLDSIGFRNFVESILTSVINKRIIRPKISGEPYIQTASTGYSRKNSRFSNPTFDQLLEYGTNDLKDYRIEDGVTQPAECKIAFNMNKHAGLLNLTWNGEVIGTIKRLNEALLDDAWVKQHSNKLIIIGVRIPTQGFNSMEYLRVKQFLPSSAGAIIIVPPSIVTKSGSDFDIDKLFMYEPNIGTNGELVNSPVISKVAHQRELDNYREQIEEINNLISVASEELMALPEYKKKEELKALLHEAQIEPPVLDLSAVKNTKKALNLEELRDLVMPSQTNFKQGVTDILREIARVKKGSSNMMELYAKIEDLKAQKDKWYEARNIAKDSVKNGVNTLYNKIITTAETVLKNAALFEQLTKPNDNNVIIPTIEKFYKSQNKSIDSPISGTGMYLPSTSTMIHRDTLESKKSLGIVAKMNALQKLYQQTGLRWEHPMYNMYYLDGVKKEGKVSLGVKYNKQLIDGQKVLVSVLQSQFVNGHVDIANEDFINRIFSDESRSPLYMQMSIQGTDLESQIIFMLQPVVNEFFARTSDNLFKDILFPGQAKKSEDAVHQDMILELVNIVDPRLLSNVENGTIVDTIKNIFDPTLEYAKILKDLNFDDSVNRYPISTAGLGETKFTEALKKEPKDIKYLKIQLAVLAQLYILRKQNDALVTLNQNIDFNTMNHQTLQSMYGNYKFLTEGKIEGISIFEIFNEESLRRLINNSIVSPFNVSGFGVDLYSRFYEVTGHPNYLEALHKHYTEEEKDQYGYDFLSRYVNKFNNDFILSVLQNSVYEGEKMIDIYPKSLFLSNGLPARLSEFKNSSSPEMQKLFQSNNFLKYLNMREVVLDETVGGKTVKTSYYFPVLSVGNASKESKEDFTAQLLALKEAKFSDLELEESFNEFVELLAMGTIVNKGFIAKLNTIQPFTSYVFYSDILNTALDSFQEILNDSVAFAEYFDNFVDQFITMNKNNYNGVPDLKDFTIKTNTNINASEEPIEERPREIETGPSFLENKILSKPKGEEVKKGIYVNKEGLTRLEQMELFNYLKPYLEQQAAKTNKGASASKMIGLGLRWDYKSNNSNRRAVNIPDVINPGNINKYGYYTESINGQPLAPISPRFRELMEKASGIDMTDYDGAIINLYEESTFISSHNDVDESRSAIGYPVIGVNLGGTGNFSIESRDGNPMTLDLPAGSAYVFGLNGINRDVFHRTFPKPQDSFLPEITTQIDGKTYPAGSYRVTVTMRRVMPLEEGMPKKPLFKTATTQAPVSNVSGIEITKSNYTRENVQNNPDTAYVFTENTHSIIAFSNRAGGGSAVIRGLDNAFAIVTKKKYDYNTRENVDYSDTPENFKEFVGVNTRLINELKNSGKSKIVFPQGFATDKAKMPTRFAEWLQKALLDNFGLVTELNSTKTGLISKSISQPTQASVDMIGPETKINIYAGTGENAELSNFANRPFKFTVQPIVSAIYGEKSFDSVEQAFQWHKGLFAEAPAQFGGSGSKTVQIMRQIKETKNGAEIKKLGQQYFLVKSKQWDSFSSVLMKDLIKSSFEQNPDALAKLLATGNATLTHKYKGVEQDGGRFSKLLMEVREELRPTTTQNTKEDDELGCKFSPKI